MMYSERPHTRFESIGLYLPEHSESTADLMDRMTHKGLIDLEDLTGITHRRIRGAAEDSLALAVRAAEDCLSRSKYDPMDLEAVIYVSISRFKNGLTCLFDPAMSLLLKRRLGAHRAIHFDVSNACAGMCTGANALDKMIRAGVVKNGIVVSGECITPIADTALREITCSDDEQLAALTVGDSGSACIIEACSPGEPGIDFMRFVTSGEFSELCMGLPSDKSPGVAMYTKSAKLQVEAVKRFPRLLEKVLIEQGARLSDYDVFIPHQTSAHAIEMGSLCLTKFFRQQLPSVISVVSEFGNTSSTSHFVALYSAIKNKQIKQGDKVLLFVLASGLVIGFVSFTVGFLEANHVRQDHQRQRLQPVLPQHVD